VVTSVLEEPIAASISYLTPSGKEQKMQAKGSSEMLHLTTLHSVIIQKTII
jgi:hypothetical protein